MPPDAGANGIRPALEVRSSGKLSRPLTIPLAEERWVRIAIHWQASSDFGREGGSVGLFKGKALALQRRALDNGANRIVEVRFGQVTKGLAGTSGTLFFDNFRSSWVE